MTETIGGGQAAFAEARPAAVPARNGLLNASIAVRANNPSIVPTVLKELSAFGASPSVENDDVRLGILRLARTLITALETPRQTMIDHNWVQVSSETLPSLSSLTFIASRGVMQPSPLATTQVCSECLQRKTNQ